MSLIEQKKQRTHYDDYEKNNLFLMLNTMEPLFQLYKLTLLAHIATKTTDPLFHEKSEEFYELLFKCFHLISEKKQDIWEDNPWDPNVHIMIAEDSLYSAKTIIEAMIKKKNSPGMDNLLRWLYDELETACGTAKGFLKKGKNNIWNP